MARRKNRSRNAPTRVEITPPAAGRATHRADNGATGADAPPSPGPCDLLREALAGAPAIVFSQDRELRYTWIHDPTPGFRQEDYLGRTDAEVLPAGEACGVLQLKRRVLTEGLPAREQFRSCTAGEETWYDLTVNPLRNLDGESAGVTGVRWDITRLKRAEEQVQRQHSILRTVLLTVPDILVLKDRDLVIRAASPALCQALGRREDEIVGCRDENLVPAEDARRYQLEDQSVLETGASLVGDMEVSTREGMRWYQMIKSPVPGPDGKPDGVLVAMRDISERKRAEEALRLSEERFRGLAETSQSLLCHCDREGRFTFLNNPWETLLGYNNKEMLGRPFHEFCLPENRDSDLKTFRRVVEDGETVTDYETGAINRYGRRVWFRFRGRPLRDRNGAIIGCMASVLNLTAQREAEQRAEKHQTALDRIESLAHRLRLSLDPAEQETPIQGAASTPHSLEAARRLVLLIERLAGRKEQPARENEARAHMDEDKAARETA